MLEDKILIIIDGDDFFSGLYMLYLDQDIAIEDISHELARLHNEGKIDLVKKYSKLENNLSDNDFFVLRHIFELSLPEIDHPIYDLMKCVSHLTKEAGSDLVAGSLANEFTRYISQNESRVSEVIKISLSEADFSGFLKNALIAGNKIKSKVYLDKSLDILRSSDNVNIQRSVAGALSAFDYDNLRDFEKSHQALEEIVDSRFDDQLWSEIILFSLNLYMKSPNLNERFEALFIKISSKKEKQIIHAVSVLLWREIDNLSDVVINASMEAIKCVDITNSGTIREIDECFVVISKKGYRELCVEVLECILLRFGRDFSITSFKKFCGYINKEDNDLLSMVVTKWFVSRKYMLCRAVSEMVDSSLPDEICPSADVEFIDRNNNDEILFVARKSIGWFYVNPVASAYFTLSLLEIAKNEEINQVVDLVFNYLLINYSGKVSKVLRDLKVTSEPPMPDIIQELEKRLEEYFDSIRPALHIAELKPPQAHREISINRMKRVMRNAYKEAERESIINLIAKKSVVLYGLKSIHLSNNKEDSNNRQVVEMNSIGTSIEVPRLEYIDPYSMDYLMRVFRVEGCE